MAPNLWIDGSIVGLYLLGTMIAGLWVRRYVGKVEDFLVAGREMNVYLGIASLAATEFGIVTCMYTAQNGFDKGFAGAIPGMLQCLAMFTIGISGFCIKPLRDSGALTVPELFEARFGPRIRWAAGVVVVLGGLLNMGVFLRVGGDFLVSVCGMNPDYLEEMMTALLIGVAAYTILGGMLSVLVTDFLQFVVMSVGLIAVTFLILHKIGWEALIDTINLHHGAGGFNPFLNPTMGWSYVLFQALLNTAATLTWQTTIARVLAAKDSRTARKVYTGTAFFFVARFMIPGIWGIAALAYFTPVLFGGSGLATGIAGLSGPVLTAAPAAIPSGNTLLAMPQMLAAIVPAGLMGLLIAAMLAADMSTDSSYMLAWGGVIYNDILAPFRRTKWSEKKGLLINRMIVALIGVFLLVYGLWYELKGDLWTYLGITGTIYLSSMSVLLIACCYWKRANSWGAAAAIVCGAFVPIATLVLERVGPYPEWFREHKPHCGVATYLIVAVAMVVGSLLKPQPRTNAKENAT